MRQYSTNEKTPAGQRRITVVGVDLGKTWIEVCGQDASGKVRLTGVSVLLLRLTPCYLLQCRIKAVFVFITTQFTGFFSEQQLPHQGRVVALKRVGGLHHEYTRKAA